VKTQSKFFFQFWFIAILFVLIIFPRLSFSQTHDVLYERTIDIFIEPSHDTTYTVTSLTKTKIKFLSERSKEITTFSIPSQYLEKVSQIEYSFGGRNYDKSDVASIKPGVIDKLISDDIIYQIKLPKVPKIGDQLYYEYKTDFYSYSFLGSFSIPNYDSIAMFSINVHHPESIRPAFIVVPTQHNILYSVDSSNTENTKLVISGITYGEYLDYYNANNSSGNVILSIKKDGKETLPVSPSGMLEWYAKLTPIQPRLDEADKMLLYDTLSKQKNELEKVHMIYDYVRKNFRYSSEDIKLSGYVPRKPSEILKSRFADCKERATLISAIAAENNIAVQYVLFPKTDVPGSSIAYPDKFDHMINVYAGKEDTVYFDATSKNCPFGVLPESEIDENVLVLENINPRWKILGDKKSEPNMFVKINARLDSLKSSHAKIHLHKQDFITYLEMKKELSQAKLETTLSYYLSLRLNKIRIENIKEEICCDDSVVLSATVDLSSFIIKTSKNNYAPITAFSLWDANIVKRKEDQLPVVLKGRFNAEIEILLAISGVEMKSQAVQIGSENLLKFNAVATSVGTETVRLTYSIFQKHRIYPSADKQLFLEFYEKYLNNRTNMFLLGENHAQKNIMR